MRWANCEKMMPFVVSVEIGSFLHFVHNLFLAFSERTPNDNMHALLIEKKILTFFPYIKTKLLKNIIISNKLIGPPLGG